MDKYKRSLSPVTIDKMTINRKVPELFDIQCSNDELILSSSNEINDNSWGAWFGKLQHTLRQRTWDGVPFNQCHFNLSRCGWADPIPLMSIAIAAAEFEDKGGNVSFRLPGLSENLSEERNRFLKYLAREGFLELLWQCSDHAAVSLNTQEKKFLNDECPFYRKVSLGDEPLNKSLLSEIKDLPINLVFDESTCLPVKLLSVPLNEKIFSDTISENIDNWVERKLLETIEPAISDKVPNWAQTGVKYRLQMFLRETLHNVVEHAYKDSVEHVYANSGYASVYIRYREGALGVVPKIWHGIDKSLKRENQEIYVPLLHREFADRRTGFFEVFVIDSGRGLCETLGNKSLHKTMLEVLEKGRSRKSQRPTQFGGLHLIQELLALNHDYIRIQDEDCWWGAELPVPEKIYDSVRTTLNAEGLESQGHKVKGVAWTVRLSWLEKTDIAGFRQPWRGVGSEKDAQPLLDECLNGEMHNEELLDSVPISDERFSIERWSNFRLNKKHPQQYVILLAGENWMKNHIQQEIGTLFSNCYFSYNDTLIIGDIVPEEALTYLAAIEKAYKFIEKPFFDIGRVILITRGLKVCILTRTKQKKILSRNEKEALRYVRGKKTKVFAPQGHLSHFYSALRQHDSRRIWNFVETRSQSGEDRYLRRIFIEAPVKWNPKITLTHFLDFPQTLTHPVCKEIYALSLQRLTSFYPDTSCSLDFLDRLVESLVTRFNTQQHPRLASGKQGDAKESKRLLIGSVRVSGLTEKSVQDQDNIKKPVFHFFRHGDGTFGGLYLLAWKRLQKKSKKRHPLDTGEYIRVGRTPVIARDGWKSYRMWRFDKDERSIYEQSPRNSYRNWQESSRALLKLGHWNYGGHHDLLSLNLILAFDAELDRINITIGSSLARYLYKNLFRIFGIKKGQLKEKGKRIWSAIDKDEYHHLLPEELAKKDILLVYPSHAISDHIIDRFYNLIEEPRTLERVRRQVVPVLPIRRHRTGSALQISGLTLEHLDNIAQKKPIPSVVFFDDAIITGRTQKELKRILRSRGFEHIYTLAIVDRQRLPSADYLLNGASGCYWRFDVPPMGSEAHCPLCTGLNKAKDLAGSLSSKLHLARAMSWQKTWTARNPATQWGDSGLRPIPIYLDKPIRKFGIKPDPDKPGSFLQMGGEDERIRITNSAGLVAWITEMHSMTSRDDLPISIMEKEDLIPEAQIQLITASSIESVGKRVKK